MDTGATCSLSLLAADWWTAARAHVELVRLIAGASLGPDGGDG